MEEATELFTIMQGMIQTSEAARLAMMRAPTPPPVTVRGPPSPPERTPTAVAASSDDFLLVGLLAMGAGAGLLAALSKRIQDVSTPTTSRPADSAGSRTG
jgi:hypothetical protein